MRAGILLVQLVALLSAHALPATRSTAVCYLHSGFITAGENRYIDHGRYVDPVNGLFSTTPDTNLAATFEYVLCDGDTEPFEISCVVSTCVLLVLDHIPLRPFNTDAHWNSSSRTVTLMPESVFSLGEFGVAGSCHRET